MSAEHLLQILKDKLWFDYDHPDITGKELETVISVLQATGELVALWNQQNIKGLSRSERNGAIAETRKRLTAAFAKIEPSP